MLKLEHLIIYVMSSYGEYLSVIDEMAHIGRWINVYELDPSDNSGRFLLEGVLYIDDEIPIVLPTMFAPLGFPDDMLMDLLKEKGDKPFVISLSPEFMKPVHHLHQVLSL